MPEPASPGLPSAWEPFDECPKYHHYCFGVIRLFLQLVLRAAASMSSASEVLKVVSPLLPWSGTPTDDCGQYWILRIGLYEITRPKEYTSDRVWIVDHTVQIGTTKCLLIVGVRLSLWQETKGPLRHQDLEVLALEPVDHSDGETVREQLEATAAKVGVPRGILSDHGTDIKRGIEDFRADHEETAAVYDIAHKVAILAKRELTSDPAWGEYLQQIGVTKQRLQQTPLAFLMPPSPKNKARYMNLEPLVNWGNKTVAFLDNPRPVGGEPVDQRQLQKHLGWLVSKRSDLARWNTMTRVIATTLQYVRQEGYHQNAPRELGRALKPLRSDPRNSQLISNILLFVKEQSAVARDGEHLIGSSECIESLIGKGKRMEGQQSKSGFTRMVLAMASAVVDPTVEYLRSALENVKTSDVTQWCRDKLGVSVQSQRRQALASAQAGTDPG